MGFLEYEYEYFTVARNYSLSREHNVVYFVNHIGYYVRRRS